MEVWTRLNWPRTVCENVEKTELAQDCVEVWTRFKISQISIIQVVPVLN
jgi:hypothetical protein